jgi:hypothetical protein
VNATNRTKVCACERVDQKKGQSAGARENLATKKGAISVKTGDGQAENTVRRPFVSAATRETREGARESSK